VLFAINGSWFPLGATLSGNVLLFTGKRPDSTLAALIGWSIFSFSFIHFTQNSIITCFKLK
jgi:hypothetical protein